MSSPKSLVLVAGGTGQTGKSIVAGLLARGTFRVAIFTRPSTTPSPDIKSLQAQGVEIRHADIATDTHGALVSALAGVSILICALHYETFEYQPRLFAAAKEARVARVVPSDFATFCPRGGVREFADKKYAYHDVLEALALGHTYIDVGWWMDIALPTDVAGAGPATSWRFYDGGRVKSAMTDLHCVGEFVARIVEDERTLGRYVFVWEEELTQKEIWDIGARLTGEDYEKNKIDVSKEALVDGIRASKEKFAATGDFNAWAAATIDEYMYSIYVRGDNTIANAKALGGALDARELYPDVETGTFERFLANALKKKQQQLQN